LKYSAFKNRWRATKMSETKHFFPGQSQEYVTPHAKDQTQ
jgi:hypothetical protein